MELISVCWKRGRIGCHCNCRTMFKTSYQSFQYYPSYYLMIMSRFALSVDPARLALLMFPPWLMKLLLWIRLEQSFLVVLHLSRYYIYQQQRNLKLFLIPFLTRRKNSQMILRVSMVLEINTCLAGKYLQNLVSKPTDFSFTFLA